MFNILILIIFPDFFILIWQEFSASFTEIQHVWKLGILKLKSS